MVGNVLTSLFLHAAKHWGHCAFDCKHDSCAFVVFGSEAPFSLKGEALPLTANEKEAGETNPPPLLDQEGREVWGGGGEKVSSECKEDSQTGFVAVSEVHHCANEERSRRHKRLSSTKSSTKQSEQAETT
jgi:hypothetical protein